MLRNCSECNKIFSHRINKLCPECVKNRNNQFNLVKDYLRSHPNALLGKVVTETGVSVERVKEFIQEGRLKVIPADYHHKCQLCGTRITSGKICNQCELRLRYSEKAKYQSDSNNKKHDAKMHLLETRRKRKYDEN